MMAGNIVMFPDPAILTNATQTQLIRIKTKHGIGNYSTDLSGFQAVLAHKATKSNYLQLVSEAYGNVSAPYREGFYDNPNVTTHILHGTRQPTVTFIDSDETKDDYDTYCEDPSHPAGMVDCSSFGDAGNNKSYPLPADSTGDGTVTYD